MPTTTSNTAEGDVFSGAGPIATFPNTGGSGGAAAMGTLSRTAGTTYTLDGYGGVCSVPSGEGGGGPPDQCEYGTLEDGTCYQHPINRPFLSPPASAKLQCDSYQTGATYTIYGPVVIALQPAKPQVTSLSPSSVNQGDHGTLTVTGINLVEGSGDQLTANLTGGTGGSPFTLTGTPSATMATFSYDFTGYPEGDWLFTVTNNEGKSTGNDFKVHPQQTSPPPAPPPDPCAVTSNPQVGFTSLVSTGTPGGSGNMTVSFSGAAFAAISPTVPYGPYSTPSSIASNIAALITRYYHRYGLTAKAFGPNIVYSGDSTIGAVSIIPSSASFSTDTSATAATVAENACHGATQSTTSCATPVSFQGTYLAPADSNGTMHWRYTWQSSSGNLGDLKGCMIDEIVRYPGYDSPYIWVHPMVRSSPNPTAPGFGPMTAGFVLDLNLAPSSYVKPYFTNDFDATQRWQYSCPCSNNGSLTWISEPITIHRKVFQQPGSSNWTYEIDKSGQSATFTPLP